MMKTLLQWLAAAALGFLLAGCRTTSETAGVAPAEEATPALSPEATARAEALARFSQGMMDEYDSNLSGALSNYVRAAQLDPNNEDLQLRIAIGLLQEKKRDEALASMEAYSRRNPKSEKALICLALIYQSSDQPDKVEEVYRRLIDLTPAKTEIYIDLASLYLRRGEERKAIALLERGVNKVERPSDVLRVLGGIYAQRAAAGSDKAAEPKYLKSAIRTFERALQESPGDAPILYQLGDLYLKNGDMEKALDSFGRILEKRPDNLPLREKLASRFREAGSPATTIAELEAVSKRQPDNPLPYYFLGELYDANDETNKALSSFEMAMTKDPTNPIPVIRLALLQMDSSPSNAIRTLSTAVEQRTNEVRLVEVLAFVYFSQKDYSNAVAYFARARPAVEQEDPDTVNPVYYFNYALACQMSGHPDDAAELLNKAIERSPSYLDAYLQYAFAQKDDSVRSASITVLEKVGQLQPDQANVYLYLGLLNSYLKFYKAAIPAFEKTEALLEDSPQKEELLDASFYFWYASACERDGQFERAEKLFAKCLTLDPEYAEAYNYLAYMWAEKGINLDHALEYIQKAITLEPDSGAFVDTLGWIYYRQGKYDGALTEIRRASELIPDDPTITEHLGDVFLKLGDEKQAVPYWEKSFVLDPENTNVIRKLEEHGINLEPLRKKADERKKELKDAPADDGSAPTGSSSGLLPITGTNELPAEVDEPSEDEEFEE